MNHHNSDRRRRAAGKLPPSNRVPQNLAGTQAHDIVEYGVASWYPLPDGKGPATQVWLHLTVAGLGFMVLRLKSARAVDELIALLERHRNNVWPSPGETKEEQS